MNDISGGLVVVVRDDWEATWWSDSSGN